MTIDDKADMEIDQLRKILLGPIKEINALRDQKILDFVKSETAVTSERLDRLEARLNEISASVDSNRRNSLAEIGDALEELGHRLKRRAVAPQTDDRHSKVRDMAVGGTIP